MTATDERLAPVVELRPAARRRQSSASSDLHAQLVAASNRLLNITATSELEAQDALGGLIGGLLNRMAPGSGALSKHDLLAPVGRVADGLGCPPAAPAAVYLVDIEVRL